MLGKGGGGEIEHGLPKSWRPRAQSKQCHHMGQGPHIEGPKFEPFSAMFGADFLTAQGHENCTG